MHPSIRLTIHSNSNSAIYSFNHRFKHQVHHLSISLTIHSNTNLARRMVSSGLLRRVALVRRATRRNNPEDTILHSHRRKNLKSYTNLASYPLVVPPIKHKFSSHPVSIQSPVHLCISSASIYKFSHLTTHPSIISTIDHPCTNSVICLSVYS
jgi:hypothetical protein